jgi:hypothetical protein
MFKYLPNAAIASLARYYSGEIRGKSVHKDKQLNTCEQKARGRTVTDGKVGEIANSYSHSRTGPFCATIPGLLEIFRHTAYSSASDAIHGTDLSQQQSGRGHTSG